MTALDDLATLPFHDADAPQRAQMLSRLADTELSVVLTHEPEGDEVQLRMFPLDGAEVALACDTEDRLADFFGTSVAYAAMPGRILARLLQSAGAGLLVNPGHPSEMLLDAQILDWLTGALESAPQEAEMRLRLTAPAADTVDALGGPLALRLGDMRGLITGAALVGIAGANTPSSHLLLIAGADPAHQPMIAKSLAEALSFLPPQPGGVDISFAERATPPGALLFDLTPPAEPEVPKGPKGPPILR